jgi:beta-lactamase class A
MQKTMSQSRRQFLKGGAAAAAGLMTAPLAVARPKALKPKVIARAIVSLFNKLPGDKAMKIFAPSRGKKSGLLAQLNSDQRLFVASADKTFVLCEALRQADSPNIAAVLEATELALDSTVWALGSPIFNSPNLTGIVSERTALEAMITRSDNTATDIMLKLVGANNVRQFIAAAGLNNTLIPDSTRALAGYLFGATNYLTLTWEQLLEVVQGMQVHPFLNEVETFASSADDFVSYYSRALQGEFFQHAATLNEFRRILSLCDFIYLVPVPLGVSAYAKSGNADTAGFHMRSFAGGMFFENRWVYFAFIINWDAATPTDPDIVNQFFNAIHQSLDLVKFALSR